MRVTVVCRCPVFVIHGKEDKVVPYEHGVGLWKKVPARHRTMPYWMEGVGHNNHGRRVEEELMTHCRRFLECHVLSRRQWVPIHVLCRSSTNSEGSNLLSIATEVE